jgi:hypothetical protein
MADNNNTGKILAILGITAGVGVGLYFLLKPKTASAKTNTGLTPSQQAQINAARLKAQQGGGTDKAVENAVKAALTKIALDKAKDALKPDSKPKSGSGPSGGGSGGGGGNDKGNKYDYKGSDYAEGYNYNYGEGEYGGSYENSDYAYGYNDNYGSGYDYSEYDYSGYDYSGGDDYYYYG